MACGAVGACSTELSPEEQDFNRRAARIRAGQSTQIVKRELGEPARIVDGSQQCRDLGGHKDWVYESFEAPAGRVQLEGTYPVFCVTNQGVVVADFFVHR